MGPDQPRNHPDPVGSVGERPVEQDDGRAVAALEDVGRDPRELEPPFAGRQLRLEPLPGGQGLRRFVCVHRSLSFVVGR